MIPGFSNISHLIFFDNYAGPLKKTFCKIFATIKSIALAFFSWFKNQPNVTETPPALLTIEQLTLEQLTIENVTETPPAPLTIEQLTIKQSLDNWASDQSCNAEEIPYRFEAAKKILSAFQAKHHTLDLRWLRLTTLPPEIGNLTQLQKLYLSYNQLTSLPDNFGNLTQLQKLYLENNQLASLPDNFGNLTQLQTLTLSYNQLTSLPDNFGNLTQLQTLNLSNNQLTSLPDNFDNLTQLQKLYLSYNQLASLPDNFDNLTQLTELDLYNNQLTSLPLTLGNFPGLTYIDCDNNPDLPIDEVQAILALCQVKRNKGALDSLPTLLNAWKAYSGKKDSYQFTLEELDEDKKRSIHEWLTRLSRAADFKNHQAELAKVVCDLLEGLKDSAFQDLFFASVRGNLDACGDRAAMQLNEIFTAYKIHFLPEGAKLKEKLDLLIRGAKTVALRRAISNKIDAWQKDNKKQTLNESVEIYLYYETELKAPLQLLTAISTTSYATGLGRVAWIDLDELQKEVNETYVKDLLGFPSTKTLIEEAPDFRQSWNLTLEDFQERLDEIRSSESLNEQQIYVQSNKLLQEHTLAKENFIKEWLEANI